MTAPEELDVTATIMAAMRDFTPRGIAAAVRELIEEGTLPSMTRLPTVRVLAGELHVSASTVSDAWRLLAREGIIRSAGRNGTVVLRARGIDISDRLERSTWTVGRHGMDLASGTPDVSLLPSIAKALRDVDVASVANYQVDSVLPGLEDVVRESWSRALSPDRLTMTHGAYAGVAAVLSALLRAGDRVVVENPSIPGVIDLVELHGGVPMPVGLDEHGIRPESLASALTTRPAVLILQPRGQNPTGVSMTWERAEELAAVLESSRTIVIEDDHCGAVSTAELTSLARWLPDRVVRIQSFSKSHGPDLRLAAMGAPREIMHRMELNRRLGGGWESMLLQRVLHELLTDPESIHAITHARRTYKLRHDLLASACREQGLETYGSDGLNLWVRVDNESRAMRRLASEDIGVCPGSPLTWDSPVNDHIRITTGVMPEAQAPRVAALLAGSAVAEPRIA
ncbi:GntR family transcriptional regulator [Aeromicrobium flavum]|uniref:GntR family transcriptional regulator n=1 Tax=Aeromicrobium flavum TaxID=416568 RepID=A0A512HVE3_9ACTN|nr:aminotransferase class I/II-fold pyridoxal phosphate-dependent enzyme [Aeromicrobium flavum]GEO89380.1 GntR family transcriptional regulator [Aeromicrobium flavum]